MALSRAAASSLASQCERHPGSVRKEPLSTQIHHATSAHTGPDPHAAGGGALLCSEWRPVERMSQSQISRTICSIAQTQYVPSTSWLNRCAELLPIDHLRRLEPTLVADTLVAFRQLGYHPGEDWMEDFDIAAISHARPFGPRATADILACMAALPGISYRFPYFVASQLLHNVQQYEQYVQLARVLRCLKHFEVEVSEEVLEAAGMRMGVLLAAMDPGEMHDLMHKELSIQ